MSGINVNLSQSLKLSLVFNYWLSFKLQFFPNYLAFKYFNKKFILKNNDLIITNLPPREHTFNIYDF